MNTWTSDNVTVNGLTLHYTRTGGNGRSLICLHGITDNGLCWTRFAQAVEAEFDVIMVDARGHGRSDAPDSGYSPAHHAADVAGLIEALGLEKPILIGHSMGAMSVAQFLVTYPDVAQCAILEDPPWVLPSLAEVVASGSRGWKEQLMKDQQRPVEAFVEDGRLQNPTWNEIEFPAWAESKKQVSPNVFSFMSGTSMGIWTEWVPQFKVPALLLTGENELGAIIPPNVAEQAASLSPSLQAVQIPKAGHSIRREQFERYVEAVRGFITAVS